LTSRPAVRTRPPVLARVDWDQLPAFDISKVTASVEVLPCHASRTRAPLVVITAGASVTVKLSRPFVASWSLNKPSRRSKRHRLARQSLSAVLIVRAPESPQIATTRNGDRMNARLLTTCTYRRGNRLTEDRVGGAAQSTGQHKWRSCQLDLRICRAPHRFVNLLDWVVEVCLGQPFRACRPRDGDSDRR
jgi:hypothetical protein